MPESISPSSSQSNQDASPVTGTYPHKNRVVQRELKLVKHKLSFKRPATQTKKPKVSPLSPPPSEADPLASERLTLLEARSGRRRLRDPL